MTCELEAVFKKARPLMPIKQRETAALLYERGELLTGVMTRLETYRE